MNEREKRLTVLAQAGMVPSGYAEKSMASLMRLHEELMEEKDRRIDLYRRLNDKEQVIAALRVQLKSLEDQVRLLESQRGAAFKSSSMNERNASSSRAKETEARASVSAREAGEEHRESGWKQW